MRRREWLTTAAGFLVAFALLGLVAWVLGGPKVLDAIGEANLGMLAVVAGLMVGWLVAWSLALRTVLGILGVDVGVTQAFLTYGAAAFANNVTPFGQAGGEPVTALLISDTTEAEFETNLAAITSVDTLNFVPSISLAALGVAYVATTATLGPRLEVAAATTVALAVVVPAIGIFAWHNREFVERLVVAFVTPVLALVEHLPKFPVTTRESVARSVEHFFDNIERVATSPWPLAVALVYSTAGWLFQALALYATFVALGHPVALAIPLIVIPLGTVASVAPLPGGLGGIESVHVALLVATTGLALPVIGAAVAIFRVGGFWLTTSVGGASTVALKFGR